MFLNISASMRIGALAFTLAILPQHANGQSIPSECPCKAVLDQGIRDSFRITSRSEFLTEMERLLRMSDDQLLKESKESGGGGSLAVPITKGLLSIGGSAGSTTERLKQIRKRLQDDQSFHLSESNFQDVAVSIANRDVLDKWESCMGKWFETLAGLAPKSGLVPEFSDLAANNVSMKLAWVRPNDQSPTSIAVTSVDLINLVEAGARTIEKGTRIGAGAKEQLFRRLDAEMDAIVVVNTDGAGAVRHIFPARQRAAAAAADAQVARWKAAMEGMSSSERRDFLHPKMLFPDGVQLSGKQFASLLEGVEGKNRLSVINSVVMNPALMAMAGQEASIKVALPLSPEDTTAVLDGLTGDVRRQAATALDAVEQFREMRRKFEQTEAMRRKLSGGG